MIVADSSSMISLAMNCMSQILYDLNADIAVTPTVYKEMVTNPLDSKRYALEAMRIKKLFSDDILFIRDADDALTNEILNVANSVFKVGNKSLKIIHKGEAEALALVEKTAADAFLIDERTARLLLENPTELGNLMSYRTRKDVKIDRKNLDSLREIVPEVPIVRSCEIAVRAFEMGIIGKRLDGDSEKLLNAVLCALKFSGCAISWEEIDEYKKLTS